MNAKLFAAIRIFLFLFSITTYSPENSAFAESEYKKQENPQTTIRALTGTWRGKAKWKSEDLDNEGTLNCRYRGTFTLNLIQKENVVTGNVETNNVKVAGTKRCSQTLSPSAALTWDVFGSGFTGTVGELSIDGQFTSDTMRGSFSGEIGVLTVNGSFKASRVSER